MKTVIRKVFANHEKEEKWLNEMSAKGFAFIDYTWCRYVFSDSQPGEYTYRLELLEYLPSHPVSQKYIQFMEESGTEHVTSYMRWVYFRKKTSDGAFDIYSDIDSKIKHYQRISLLYLVIGIGNLLASSLNFSLWLGLLRGDPSYPLPMLNLTVAVMSGILGLGILIVFRHPLRRKMKKLKKDKLILE